MPPRPGGRPVTLNPLAPVFLPRFLPAPVQSAAVTTQMGTCTSNSGPANANNQPTTTTTTTTAHVGNEQEGQAAIAQTSAGRIAEYWACQQGTGHCDHANVKCPECQSLNTANYDGTRTSYDYCKDCKHEWNRWYD